MISLGNDKKTDELLKYLTEVSSLQRSIEGDKMYYITIIPLFLAAKNGLIISELLLHPLVTFKINYYEEIENVSSENLHTLLKDIIIYETTCDIKDIRLSQEVLKTVIKKYKELSDDINTL